MVRLRLIIGKKFQKQGSSRTRNGREAGFHAEQMATPVRCIDYSSVDIIFVVIMLLTIQSKPVECGGNSCVNVLGIAESVLADLWLGSAVKASPKVLCRFGKAEEEKQGLEI